MEIVGLIKNIEEISVALGGAICIYFGYRLFVLGTNQTFNIFADMKGWKFKAANIAPGGFLVVLGSLVICSLVTTRVISVIQQEAIRNSNASKQILYELRKMN
ncbi:MAG: hypothetical protein JSU72_20190, partial [Deltaproteobacteria bacterium]